MDTWTTLKNGGVRMLEGKIKKALIDYKTLDVDLNYVIKLLGKRVEFKHDEYLYHMHYNRPFDESKGEVIEINRSDFENIMGKFLEGEITKEELIEWANIMFIGPYQVESDLNDPGGPNEVLAAILNELMALPAKSSKIDKKQAQYFLDCIHSGKIPR